MRDIVQSFRGARIFLYSAKWLQAIAVGLHEEEEKEKWIKNDEQKLNDPRRESLRLGGREQLSFALREPGEEEYGRRHAVCRFGDRGEGSDNPGLGGAAGSDFGRAKRCCEPDQDECRGGCEYCRQLLINEMSMTLNALSGCVMDSVLKDLRQRRGMRFVEVTWR